MHKSRKPGGSFSFSVGFLHVRISVSYLVGGLIDRCSALGLFTSVSYVVMATREG